MTLTRTTPSKGVEVDIFLEGLWQHLTTLRRELPPEDVDRVLSSQGEALATELVVAIRKCVMGPAT